MSKVKELFQNVCEKYKKEHDGCPENEVSKQILSNFSLSDGVRYLKRPEVYHLGPFKKKITVWCLTEEEAANTAFEVHKQLIDNNDYLTGKIIVELDPNDGTVLNIYVLNTIEYTMPQLFV